MQQKLLLKIENWCYNLLMFFLPISLFFDNIFLCFLFITVFLKKNKLNSNNLVIFTLGFFFIYVFINSILKDSLLLNKESIIKLLPFLLLPYCLGNISKKVLIKGCLFLMAGVILIQINAIIGVLEYYYFTEGKKYALNNYSKVNDIIRYERPYLGFFSALNVIFSIIILRDLKKIKIAIIISLLSLFIIILISARLALLIVFLSTFFYLLNKFKLKKIIFYSLLLIAILTFSVFTNKSLKERFSQLQNDARLITWTGAYEISKKEKKYITGIGSQNKIKKLYVSYYKEYANYLSEDEKNRFVKKNYNTHNQYLNEYLRGGVLGLILFITPLFLIFIKNYRNKNILEVIFLFSIISFCIVENVIQRQVGVYLYIIILSISNMAIFNNEFKKVN